MLHLELELVDRDTFAPHIPHSSQITDLPGPELQLPWSSGCFGAALRTGAKPLAGRAGRGTMRTGLRPCNTPCIPRAPVVPSKKVFEVDLEGPVIPSEEVRLEP